MRVVWAKFMKNLIYNEKYLPSFIDESSIKLKTGKGYSLVGVQSFRLSNLSLKSMSICTWTIPFYGFILSYYYIYIYMRSGFQVIHPLYSNFLIKGNHLLRNAIVAPDIKLLTIQDNNPPHKTDMVYETFKTINMPFVNTVEYSCELNEVAENMFKVIKIEDLYLQKILKELHKKRFRKLKILLQIDSKIIHHEK